jgi:subtilisin family serine protease
MRHLSILLFCNACTIDAGIQPAGSLSGIDAPHVEDQLIVGLVANLGQTDRLRLFESLGLRELDHDPVLLASQVRLALGMTVPEAMVLLQGEPGVRFAEPEYLAQALTIPNDPYYSVQWNLHMVDAEGAWAHTTGVGTLVAVLDTGVYTSGDDGLNAVRTGWNFIDGSSDTSDVYGHGTHVAGTIAQSTHNGQGAAGLAHGSTILPVKVLGDDGWGSSWAIASGMEWAADQGADVINLSLGSWGSSQLELDAVRYARDRGVVLVAAAGNESYGQLNWPAAYDGVISVAAVDSDGDRASYSNWGDGLDISAPGGVYWDGDGDGWYDGIWQEVWSGSGWAVEGWQGTSMASPHVAAAAAMLKSLGVDDPDYIEEILEASAWDRGNGGWDTDYGAGVLDVGAAVGFAIDEGDNEAIGEEDTGEEGTVESEPTAPVITNVQFGSPGEDDFWLSWETDQPATSDIVFEDWGEYSGDGSLQTGHHREFWGSSGGTYRTWIRSTNEDGLTTTDGPYDITL